MAQRTCTIDECGKKHYGKGYCSAHYTQWRKHGNPLHKDRPTFGMTAEQAFRHYMPGNPPPAPSPTEGCWIWQGPTEAQGYGHFKAGNGKAHKAHRVAYELFVGPIPDGHLIRHTCDTRNCVQPAHHIPGTDADNNQDMMERGRNQQPKGIHQGSAKLTDEQVHEIRATYALGGISQRELGERYGVVQTAISRIVRYRGWTHVD